jgi:hypothetical protein
VRKVKLQSTPITDSTFERQGWSKHNVSSYDDGDIAENEDELDTVVDGESAYLWILPLPKERRDAYAPRLVSSISDSNEELVSMGLSPGQYFIEILDFDGLGFCTTEEELEILYRALTGKYIEQ